MLSLAGVVATKIMPGLAISGWVGRPATLKLRPIFSPLQRLRPSAAMWTRQAGAGTRTGHGQDLETLTP